MARFKMDYFKGMTYDDIHPIFEKKFNSNVAFLEKTREQMEEEDSKAIKRISVSQAEKAAKKQKLDEEARSSLKNVLMYEALLSFFVTDIPLVSSEVDSFVMFLTKSEGSRRLNRVFIVMLQHSYTSPLNTAISGSVTFTAALDHVNLL
nr:probable WRKY transcription factor 4 [Tanacetum cinerariifolium]